MQNANHHRAGAGRAGLLFVSIAVLAMCLSSRLLPAAESGYRIQALKEAPPAEVSENVRKVCAGEGLQVLGPGGEPFVDVWLRKAVATREDPKRLGLDFGALKDGTLLGIIRFHEKSDDFRGNSFRPGLYTFRYAIRPEDGDHQGTSDTLDFALLCPVDLDVKPDPMPTEEVVKLSVKVSRRKHPSVLYLVKMFERPDKLPRLVNDEDREYWVLDFEVPVEGKSGTTVRMGLVLVGLAPGF